MCVCVCLRVLHLLLDRLKPFSIRTLLDLCQECLVEYGFDDPWREVKQVENAAALEQLRQRLDELDELEEGAEKWTELLRGVFAGKFKQMHFGFVFKMGRNKKH